MSNHEERFMRKQPEAYDNGLVTSFPNLDEVTIVDIGRVTPRKFRRTLYNMIYPIRIWLPLWLHQRLAARKERRPGKTETSCSSEDTMY